MKKLFSIFSISVLGLGVAASAQTFTFTQQNQAEELNSGLTGRASNAMRPAVKVDNFSMAKGAKVNYAPQREGEVEVTDLGTVLTPPLLFEDFSLMGGTPESPDYAYDQYLPEPPNYWQNMRDGLTLTSGWGNEYCYPAGGQFLMDVAFGGFARVTTPLVDISANGGVATLRVKAKTMGGETMLMMEHAETNGMGPTWSNMVSTQVTIGEEWGVYEFTVQDGAGSAIFNIAAQKMSMDDPGVNVLIDEITVIQYDLHVGIPTLNGHTNYTGESFDISWGAADKAESYLVDVYTVIPGDPWMGIPDEPVYLYQDVPVTGTSWTVTGIENGATYYYTVRGVKGEYVSLSPTPVVIFDLVAPVLDDVASISADGLYIADWSVVPSAEVYNYWAYCDRYATEAGRFVVTDENFDGITNVEGELTGWTKEEPSYQCYWWPGVNLHTLAQGGWMGTNYAPYTDYICLDVWHYLYGNGDSGLISPELDLSKDGGNVKVNVTLCSEIAETWDAEGNTYMGQTGCAVALFNYDETVGDFVQSELIYVEGISVDWQDFEIDLTTGTERSIIGLYGVRAAGNLYIDNLKITQNYEEGDMLRDPFLFARYHAENTIEVTIPGRAAEMNIWHKVSAIKGAVSDNYGMQQFDTVESDFSDLKFVGTAPQAGVESMTALSLSAFANVRNGKLQVVNPAAEAVAVYDLAGNLILDDNSGSDRIDFNLPAKGVYVVKVGNKVIKVVR